MVCRGRRRRHKTAVAISTADSVPIQTMTYPTCSYQSIGIPESRCPDPRRWYGRPSPGQGKPTGLCRVLLGMPCYGENPANDREIVRLLTDALTPVPVYVVNDGEVGWAGSLACGEGIHIVSGTGSIAFGRGCDKEFARWGVGGVFWG